MSQPPASTQSLEHFRSGISQQPAFAAQSQLFFEEQSRRKRSAPTPVASSSRTTPQEVEGAPQAPTQSNEAASSSTGVVVTRPHLDDHTAYQLTAGQLGHDVNDAAVVEKFLNSKVTTARDVLRLLKGYHEAIIRPELYGAVVQLEYTLKAMNDRLFATQSELRFMASDNRSQQKHQSGLMLVTTGWPTGMTPSGRHYMLGWMISQLPEAATFLVNRRYLDANFDHTALPAEVWFNVLSVEPTTIPQGKDFYSPMTMLTFKAWDLRSAFLTRYGGTSGTPLYSDANTPQAGRHIRVSPCAPQWQRKLESPLRVLIAVCNAHEDTANKKLTILWKSLTLMAPSDSPDLDHSAVAWARLFYEENNGTFRGRLEVSPEMSRIMMSGPVNVDAKEENLWSEKWNEIMWGQQLQFDEMDHAAYQSAKQIGMASGRGTSYGGGRRHWSNTLLHNSYFSPYPFDLDLVQVEAVAYIWDEYAIKAGSPNECIGDLKVCTFAGKPAAAPGAAEQPEVEMGEAPTMPPPSTVPSKAAAPQPAKGNKGRGRGPKGA